MELVSLVSTDKALRENGDVLQLPCTVNYYYITSNNQAKEAIQEILTKSSLTSDMLALDLETTGLDPYLDNIILLQVGTADDIQYIFDIRTVDLELLIPVLKQPCWIAGHNLKFEAKFLKVKLGINLTNMFDTFLAEKVIRGGEYIENAKYSLDGVVSYHLNRDLKIITKDFISDPDMKVASAKKQMQKSFIGLNRTDRVLSEAQLAYAAQDVSVGTIFDLVKVQIEKLNISSTNTIYDPAAAHLITDPKVKQEYEKVFPKELTLWPTALLEFKFLEVVVDLELRGMKLCEKTHDIVMKYVLEDYSAYKDEFLNLMAEKVRQKTLLGKAAINPNSQPQVLEAFGRLGLELEDTKEETLETLLLSLEENSFEYKAVKTFLDYRKLSKILTTYGQKLRDQIHPTTKRIHPDIQQIINTGRISMKDPNLQQQPSGINWKLTGDPVKDEEISNRPVIKSCYVAEKGYKLLTYDYSQQELRIAASISSDQMMLSAYRANKDLHCFSVSLMYSENYDEIFRKYKVEKDEETVQRRVEAKVVSFGTLYGSGAPNLAAKLRLSIQAALHVISRYWESYPDLKRAMDRYGRTANKLGYSNTILGRRRYFTDKLQQIKWVMLEADPRVIQKKVEKLKMDWLLDNGPITYDNIDYAKDKLIQRFRNKINREAGNMGVQGSAADIGKIASVLIQQEIRKNNLDAYIIGLVHDEMITEAREKDVEVCKKIIIDKMREAQLLFCPNVPAEVEGKVSNHWEK